MADWDEDSDSFVDVEPTTQVKKPISSQVLRQRKGHSPYEDTHLVLVHTPSGIKRSLSDNDSPLATPDRDNIDEFTIDLKSTRQYHYNDEDEMATKHESKKKVTTPTDRQTRNLRHSRERGIDYQSPPLSPHIHAGSRSPRASANGPHHTDRSDDLHTSWQDLNARMPAKRRAKQNRTTRSHLMRFVIVVALFVLAIQLLPLLLAILGGSTAVLPGFANRQPMTLIATHSFYWDTAVLSPATTTAVANTPMLDQDDSSDLLALAGMYPDIQLRPYVRASFSPNSQQLLLLADQKRVVEIDLLMGGDSIDQQGIPIRREIGAGLLERPDDVAASDTGFVFVLDSALEMVRVFNAQTGALSHDVPAPKCQSMAVVRATGTLILADTDGRIRVLATKGRATVSEETLSFEIPGCDNRKCAHHRSVDSDGKILVIAYYDKVHVFDASTGHSLGIVTKEQRSYLQPQVALLPGTMTALLTHNRMHMLHTMSLNAHLLGGTPGHMLTDSVTPLTVHSNNDGDSSLDAAKTELYDIATDSLGKAIVVTAKGQLHVLQVQYF
eukprot:TRINITY_DN2557_c1_g1_i1.p1 TRINITY_DN2557_c1_g1~~TRINITY_DN2557_c1_g1_i1.p1  ORF type:complete len:554 (-),score=94.33 TRINITY_DN2557_c1_g1_i1:240-1901(-)